MPITPLHFGAGILGKAIAPRRLSLTAFVCTQVAIDVETLTRFLLHRNPRHKFCHTIVGGSLVGLGVALLLWLAARELRRRGLLPEREFALGVDARSELSASALAIGGLYGGVSHAVLDAMIHSDCRPLAPWVDSNPWLCSLYVSPTVCVAAGALGLAIWWARNSAYRRRTAGPQLR